MPPDRAIGLGPTSSTNGHAAICLGRMVLIELAARMHLAVWRHRSPIGYPYCSGRAANLGESERHLIGAALIISPPYALLTTARTARPRCSLLARRHTRHEWGRSDYLKGSA